MLYNIVIVGAGNISSGYDNKDSLTILTHAHAIVDSGLFKLIGFVDLDYNRAKEAADKWGGQAYKNLQEINKKIDVVCCAVPDKFHYKVLMDIVKSITTKVVICEKPITKNVEEAYEIMQMCENKKITLIVNYTRRFLEEFLELKEKIRGYGNLLGGNCYYGKGVLHNCSHMLNLLYFLLGELKIYNIKYKIYDFYEDDPSESFDIKVLNGIVNFIPIDCQVVTVFEFDLLFEKGRVKYDDATTQLEYYEIGESSVFNGELNYQSIKSCKIEQDKAMINLYKNVFAILENNDKPCCSGMDAVNTLELCENITKR